LFGKKQSYKEEKQPAILEENTNPFSPNFDQQNDNNPFTIPQYSVDYISGGFFPSALGFGPFSNFNASQLPSQPPTFFHGDS
jgi:hypothetical protein